MRHFVPMSVIKTFNCSEMRSGSNSSQPITVYGVCGVIFLAGAGLFVYMSVRPIPVSISSIAAESVDPLAEGIPVDLDRLRVRWSSVGDPEDISVALEAMESHRRTAPKTILSTEGLIEFSPDDYANILQDRTHGGMNRMRVDIQTAKSAFTSPEFMMRVGTTILAAHVAPNRIKIMGMIDNRAIDFYNFEAKFLVWASGRNREPAPITFGGNIAYGQNDFQLDATLTYDWSTKKLVYFGPDDHRIVRTQFIGF
jgi:hypothetical protein